MKTFSICILLIGCVIAARGEGVPGFALRPFTHDSDVIVVGEVVSVEAGATSVHYRDTEVPGKSYKITVKVFRALKGEAPDQFSFDYGVPLQSVGIRPITSGTRLLFLKVQPDGSFMPTSPYYPSLPALATVSSQKSSSALQAVMNEMGAVLTSPQSSKQDKYRAAWAGTFDDDFWPYLKQGVDNNDDPELRATLIGMLVGHGDVSHLDELPRLLSDFHASSPLRDNLLAAIPGIKNAAGMPVISVLLKSREVEVRRAAVQALSRNSSTQAESLLKASLSDSDLEVQLHAIRGLAKRHNQPGVTLDMSEFRAHHNQYVKSFQNLPEPDRK